MIDQKKKGAAPKGNALPHTTNAFALTNKNDVNSDRVRKQDQRSDLDTVLVELRHTQHEVIRISIRELRGRTRIDARIWFQNENGTWHPSQKGFSINPRQIPEVVRGLMLAGQAFDPKEAS
ncbi:transcriptional coactivator p15/PC4 family protein [Caballeronia grimmiae]|uniref:transcriptional coactivator p15/PC4 family protein n=1 Tax=Caballeronia grimmiae TaxID=1071679 RepID=UPI0038BB0F43